MKIIVCDACQTVLEKEIQEWAGDYYRKFDLCPNCKEKFEKIKSEYYKQDEELQEERKKLYDNYKEKLKEIGIKYEL